MSAAFADLPNDVVRRLGGLVNVRSRARLASTHRDTRRVLEPTAESAWRRAEWAARKRFDERLLYAFLECARGVLAVARSHAARSHAARARDLNQYQRPLGREPSVPSTWKVRRDHVCRRVSIAGDQAFEVVACRAGVLAQARDSVAPLVLTGFVKLGDDVLGTMEFWRNQRGGAGKLLVWSDQNGLSKLPGRVANATRVGNRVVSVTVGRFANMTKARRPYEEFSTRLRGSDD